MTSVDGVNDAIPTDSAMAGGEPSERDRSERGRSERDGRACQVGGARRLFATRVGQSRNRRKNVQITSVALIWKVV